MQMNVVGDRGAALLGVVGVALLLSLLAVGVMDLTLISRKIPVSVLDRKQAEYLADSASVLYLRRHLINETNSYVLSNSLEVLGRNVAVDVELENSKVGLNKADYDLLSATIASNGYDVQLAESIANAIIDWRDEDDFVTGAGAELATYQTEGYSYAPRNGPFETVGELAFVRGVSPAMVRCLLPVLTVYSSPDIEDVNLVYASEKVKDIFAWAYQNNWHDRLWPNIEETLSASGSLDLSSQAITIRTRVAADLDSQFSKIIRIKTSTSEAITYVTLRSLNKDGISGSCPTD